jgi:formate hydrogenlyase subunit 6/NADH:ubiquinone oxidoreductase subunit I
VSSCKRGAVYYGTGFFAVKPVNEERRETLHFMFSAAAAFFTYLSYLPATLAQEALNLIPVIKKNTVIIPPGAGSIKRFRELCTGCGLCVTACPTKVLTQVVKNRRGRLEPFQPSMDYAHAYCSYNCTVCTQVCPTGAIKELSVEEKRTKALGAAKFIQENCVVVTNGKPCVVCDEHCPEHTLC